MEAKEKGAILDVEAEAFLADVECTSPYSEPLAITTTTTFKVSHEDAYASDVDEAPHAATSFMANLMQTGPSTGQGTSNDTDFHSEVQTYDNHFLDNMHLQVLQEIHGGEQLDSDVDSVIDDHDNTISYHQYQLNNKVESVPTDVSSGQNCRIKNNSLRDENVFIKKRYQDLYKSKVESNSNVSSRAAVPEKLKVLAHGIKSVTEASKSKSKCETKTHRNLPSRSENVKRVDNPLRSLNKMNCVDSSLSVKRTGFISKSVSICKTCNECSVLGNHNKCGVKNLNSVNCKNPKVNNDATVKQVWKATGNIFASVGSKWRPTGRKFTLGNTCPLTGTTKLEVVPLEKSGSVSTSELANNVIVTPRFSKKPLTSYKLKDTSIGSPPNAETKAVNDPVECKMIPPMQVVQIRPFGQRIEFYSLNNVYVLPNNTVYSVNSIRRTDIQQTYTAYLDQLNTTYLSSDTVADQNSICFVSTFDFSHQDISYRFIVTCFRPMINQDTYFELKGKFLKELHDNTFSGSEHKDANEHIEKVLEIVDLFHIPKVTQDQIMLRAFHVSLTGAASRWIRNQPSGSITTWEVLKTKCLNKYCPPARTAKKMEEINNF
ncbi:retrovirus-related pol polyprotein from transposon TNT 1-94 [Tanacetum coccineum]